MRPSSWPDKIWPKSVEAQLQSGQAGDFWLVDGAKLDVDKERNNPNSPRNYIRIGAADGMQDFTMSLKQLIDDELIDRPTAFEVAPNPDALKMALKGINVAQPGMI